MTPGLSVITSLGKLQPFETVNKPDIDTYDTYISQQNRSLEGNISELLVKAAGGMDEPFELRPSIKHSFR